MDEAIVLGSVFALHLLAMVSPGPNFLIVTQTALSRTRRSAVWAAFGIAMGAAIWSSVALLGLSVLFEHYGWLYGGLRLMGGIYLIYLGVELWRTAGRPSAPSVNEDDATGSDWQALRLGLFTNLLNPKAAVFFGSIFAALVTPDLPMWIKLTAIGIIVVDATAWHIALACFFSTERAQQSYQRLKHWIDRITGAALTLFGLRLILQSR